MLGSTEMNPSTAMEMHWGQLSLSRLLPWDDASVRKHKVSATGVTYRRGTSLLDN